jgi:hypothetical protein|tara:strand:+ start:6248 stop:6640 length:393 start_codon:yes stop_codon:yes gene_type:complete
MATQHTDQSIRNAQRRFAPVFKAFLQQWPTQHERVKFAEEACGTDWIGSHSCGFDSESSCVVNWASDKTKISLMGPRFYVAVEEMNKAAFEQGFTPITFRDYGDDVLPTASDFWAAFHGLGAPICFVIAQ